MSAATTRLAGAVDRWLFGPESAARLRVTYLGLATLLGLRIALGPYRDLTPQPAALFDPPWFLTVLDAMPSAGEIVAIQVAGAGAAAAALWPRLQRFAFPVAWLALLVLAGLRDSRGKILHNDVLLLLVCVPFLAAPVVASVRDRRRGRSWGWPVRSAMVVIALAYFFCGFGKLVSSGPAWAFSDNMRHILYAGAAGTRTNAGDLTRWIADHAFASIAVATAMLAFELAFPLAIAVPRLRPAFVVFSVGLHAGTWVLLGLDYWLWAAVVPLVLVDWPAAVERVTVSRARASSEAPYAGPDVRAGADPSGALPRRACVSVA